MTPEPTEAPRSVSHKMQHLMRRPSKYDYLPSSYGSEILGNGFCSSGITYQADPRSKSINFGTDGFLSGSRLQNSALEERQQHNVVRSVNPYPYDRPLHKNGATTFTDIDGRQNASLSEPKVSFRGESNHGNSRLLSLYTSCPNHSSNSTCTLPSFLNLTGAQVSTASSDYISYSSAPLASSRTRQDQVLDQNYDTLAKSMLELTDGGSRPTSRASSSVRVPEANINNNKVTNSNVSNEKGKSEHIIPEAQVNSTVVASSNTGTLTKLMDENRAQRTIGESNPVLNHQINVEPQSKQPPFNSHDPLQSINPAILEDVNLAAQLNQLNLNYSGHNGEIVCLGH